MSELRLRVHDADPERVERIRALCVSALESRRRETQARAARARRGRRWLEPAVAVGVCLLYLAEAFSRALAVFR